MRSVAISKPLELNELENGISKSIGTVKVEFFSAEGEVLKASLRWDLDDLVRV